VKRRLIIPLGGGQWSERTAPGGEVSSKTHGVEIARLSSLATRRGLAKLRQGFQDVQITGAPPESEIGFSLASLLALAASPEAISLYDEERDALRRLTRWKFSGAVLPFVLTQVGASSAAIMIQRIAASLVSHRSPPNSVRSPLRRMLYLRPSVGTGMIFGGSVTHAHGLIRALRTAGVEVAPVTTDPAIASAAAHDPDPPCEWTVAPPTRLLRMIPASAAVADDLALLERAGRSRPDVIYQRHARFSLAGALLAHRFKRPLFLEYNGSEEFVGRYWNRTPLLAQLALCEQAVLHTAARIFVVSEVDRRSLIVRGMEPERIVLSPNAVDAERFGRGGGPEIRRELGLDADAIVIGFVGTFGPWHGAPTLARALRVVAARHPGFRGLFIGAGPELEGTRAEIQEAGLVERVTFLGGVEHSRIPAYLDACDILVSPQTPLPGGIEFFGSPTKVFEYMAAGKAIVASRLGQIGEVLVDEETALLVEPGSVENLAHALSVASGDPALRKRLGAAARARALEKHSWRDNARLVAEAYHELSSNASGVS
jgi:glycosyltransferase involved in cell wall biosynthesis